MRLFSRAAFARLADVSGAAVTKVAKKWPAEAFESGRIDVDHPGPRAYLASRGITEKQVTRSALAPPPPEKTRRKRPALPTTRRGRPPKADAAPPAPRPAPPKSDPEAAPAPTGAEPPVPDLAAKEPPTDEVIARIRDALLPILGEFGAARNIADWIETSKNLELLMKARLANEEARGKVIAREIVRTAIFGAFDAVALRLLRDLPKTISRETYALAKADAPIEEAEAKTQRYVSKILEPLKMTVAKWLRDGAPGGAEQLALALGSDAQ